MNKVILLVISGVLFGCATGSLEQRSPSSEESAKQPEDTIQSYKLPITREGKTLIRVAYNFWSGEYPNPIIDVNSSKPGTTTISAYTSLRDLKDVVSCTIQNGVYNPWSKNARSLEHYYTLTAANDFLVLNDMVITKSYYGSGNEPKSKKIKVPAGSKIINVVYGSENFCAATLRIGSNLTPIDESCDFFFDNPKKLQAIFKEKDQFSEQWLHLNCSETTSTGAALKAFVNADALMSQKDKGIREGCPAGYGNVSGAGSVNCGQ